MSFGQAVRTCLRKYAVFSGRASRAEYWWFYLARVLITLPFGVFATLGVAALFVPVWGASLEGNAEGVEFGDLYWGPLIVAMVLTAIVYLLFLLPSLAVETRRLHDMGQPGWWVLLNFALLGIVPVVMCILPSVPGRNEYGEPPAA